VSTSEAESFALENDVRYIEVDAMANKNIEDAFDLICERKYSNVFNTDSSSDVRNFY
jgi:hypothetical protein